MISIFNMQIYRHTGNESTKSKIFAANFTMNFHVEYSFFLFVHFAWNGQGWAKHSLSLRSTSDVFRISFFFDFIVFMVRKGCGRYQNHCEWWRRGVLCLAFLCMRDTWVLQREWRKPNCTNDTQRCAISPFDIKKNHLFTKRT